MTVRTFSKRCGVATALASFFTLSSSAIVRADFNGNIQASPGNVNSMPGQFQQPNAGGSFMTSPGAASYGSPGGMPVQTPSYQQPMNGGFATTNAMPNGQYQQAPGGNFMNSGQNPTSGFGSPGMVQSGQTPMYQQQGAGNANSGSFMSSQPVQSSQMNAGGSFMSPSPTMQGMPNGCAGNVSSSPMMGGQVMPNGMSGSNYGGGNVSSPMMGGQVMPNGMTGSNYGGGNVSSPMGMQSMPGNMPMQQYGGQYPQGSGGTSGFGGHPLFNRIKSEFMGGGAAAQNTIPGQPGQPQQGHGALGIFKDLFGPPTNVQEAEQRAQQELNTAENQRQQAINKKNAMSGQTDKGARASLASEAQNHAREARSASDKVYALSNQFQSANLSNMAAQARDAANYAQSMADQAEGNINNGF